MGALSAYLDAFEESDGAGLVLKTINGSSSPEHERLIAAARGRADVSIIDALWSEREMRAFPQLLDAYVSLHRAEGTGLTMLDAMAAGTPVVATGYSGNLDFMDGSVARLVPFTLMEIGPDAAPYLPSAVWAEPDQAAASEAMRVLKSDPEGAVLLGKAGQAQVAARCGRELVADWFAKRLEDLNGW